MKYSIQLIEKYLNTKNKIFLFNLRMNDIKNTMKIMWNVKKNMKIKFNRSKKLSYLWWKKN